MPVITVLPDHIRLQVSCGDNLLECLRAAGVAPEAPCGGRGKCGKCKVLIGGEEVLSCHVTVQEDMTVTRLRSADTNIMTEGIDPETAISPLRPGMLLAVDIGTTTVVGFLLDGETGTQIARRSVLNPQAPYGADVISRIQYDLKDDTKTLTKCIREGLTELIRGLCSDAGIGPEEIGVACVVGNPAMQQLFLGLSVENLAKIPFAPVLKQMESVEAGEILPILSRAALMIVPDISGFVGADTVACVLASGMDRSGDTELLVDIGTNGEMVLTAGGRMVACSAAAGPALEGANIRFGMRGQKGAIDHVSWNGEGFDISVIGGGAATGICGSGLIDAAAAALDGAWINFRGRVQPGQEIDGQRIIPLTDGVYLTQDDIRQLQMAKGAIAAGIEMMCDHLQIQPEQIDRVYLAGAFGSFMDPEKACRIGLLLPELSGKILAIGNAAGSGARMLARDSGQMARVEALIERCEFIELASDPEFQYIFAEHMGFDE